MTGKCRMCNDDSAVYDNLREYLECNGCGFSWPVWLHKMIEVTEQRADKAEAEARKVMLLKDDKERLLEDMLSGAKSMNAARNRITALESELATLRAEARIVAEYAKKLRDHDGYGMQASLSDAIDRILKERSDD